jgi:hypothetical protein
MDSNGEDLKRLAECLAPQRRWPGQQNPDDFISREQFEKALGPGMVAIQPSTKKFADGDLVRITWDGGNGPYEYVLRNDKYENLVVWSRQGSHIAFVDSLEFRCAKVEKING